MTPWSTEIWRLSGLILFALVLGLIIGYPLQLLFAVTVCYLGWHLFNLFHLEYWLRMGGKSKPPTGRGIWSDIYVQFYRIRQRNRKQKRKLADVINRFRESTAAMPDATVILSASGSIEWINEAASSLLGLNSTQDIGQRLNNLIRHPDFLEYLEQADYTKTIEIKSPNDDQIILEISIIPYGKNQRLLIARNITRIKKLEQMRRDFIANVSHELRTPLTVISGFIETMTDNQEENTKNWQRSLELMKQQTARMQHIVDDLLLLSRLETSDKEVMNKIVAVPVILATLKEDAILLSGDQHHDIRLEAENELWLIGNEKQLHSAFSNLIANAVRYTPENGKISIRWFRDDTGAHLQVEDSGIGIAPEHVPRLTERFYRIDVGRSRETGGTGLGLAIVKHVLERHQATLEINSELNKGSIFTCHFPSKLIHIKEQKDNSTQTIYKSA